MAAKPSSPRDTLYLQRIGERWYCRVPVPNSLRKELGPYLRKALDTSDIKEARKRRWDYLPIAKATIEAAAARLGVAIDGKPTPQKADSYAAFRARLEKAGPVSVNASDGEEMVNPAVEAVIDLAQRRGEADDPAFMRAFEDHRDGLLRVSDLRKDYLAKRPKRSKTTEANYETVVNSWIDYHGDHSLRNVSRSKALEWLNEATEGKARDTIKRYVTVMSNLWKWSYRSDDKLPANPFAGLATAADDRGKPTESYGHLTDAEVVTAYKAVADDDALRACFLISIYTGFRLNECLTAKREMVHGVECYVLAEGKTANSVRAIPVHPKLAEVVQPADAKASTLSVRAGRLFKRAGVPEGKTFHSLRKRFATALERLGCPEAMAVRLLGHKPISLTYSIYSEGRHVKDMKLWVDRVTQPV
ncbi:tyrosine-type recombinase/integrase [Methylovirgula sp. 4M-Z18]|uniref:tyrosine-type recombinase/integrase n=1 Tax=Methylovirgula sp. 4M-Z18 TaxID=2293567 RepID=UPI000E2E7657|nr:tyrosine-type recombinase/integrase [Methylovirgula sp. 4M-Z18]RFB78307.1 hypothetical protein DYH55_16285 [Methylovirgula sp. 4M-Z18]